MHKRDTFQWRRTLRNLVLLLLVVTPVAFAEPQILRMLVWEGYAPVAKRQAFQRLVLEKYGVDLHIEVNYIAETEDCYSALRLKKADILSPAHNRINDSRFRMLELGLLLPLNLDNIPNYADVADGFKNLQHLTYQGKTYGMPFGWGPYGLIYNAKRVKEPPTSWQALWSPEYQGKYIVSDLGEHNVYITALAQGYTENDLKSFDTLNSQPFRGMLAQLAVNSNGLWLGVDTADDLKNKLLATSWGFSLPELRARGENWKWAPLKEKVPGWIDNFVISHTLKDRPVLRRIAEEWINYTLSPEFQAEVLVKELSARPVNVKTKHLLSQELIETVGLENLEAAQDMFVLMPELDRRTRNGFDLLWKQAMAQRVAGEERKIQ